LARQCFINEYVFVETESEVEAISKLLTAIEEAIEASTARFAAACGSVAAYRPSTRSPCGKYPAQALALAPSKPWSMRIARSSARKEFAWHIVVLTAIEDSVSQEVRRHMRKCLIHDGSKQRWVGKPVASNGPAQPVSRRAYSNVGRHGPLDVLIAGCGTDSTPLKRHAVSQVPRSRPLISALRVCAMQPA